MASRIFFFLVIALICYYFNHQVSGSVFSLLNFKFKMEEKSRSHVMYDTWFSSCGHFERVTATVGVWNNDTTYKPYWRKRNSWFFFKDSVLLFPLSTVYDFRQHTSSEEINVSPSRNLFSENAENQATFRDSDRCNDIRLFFNVSSDQILEKIRRHFQRFGQF